MVFVPIPTHLGARPLAVGGNAVSRGVKIRRCCQRPLTNRQSDSSERLIPATDPEVVGSNPTPATY